MKGFVELQQLSDSLIARLKRASFFATGQRRMIGRQYLSQRQREPR